MMNIPAIASSILSFLIIAASFNMQIGKAGEIGIKSAKDGN
jgi:hypothetical protein